MRIDYLAAERDAALTGACTADRNGSDCRDLVRDALIAQDRLPGDFILNAGNGYGEAPIRYGEYGAENSGDPRLDAVAARERAHIVEYNSTENVLAPYEDIAQSIARDQGLALIIGGGMTLAVLGGGGSRPAGGGTVRAKGAARPTVSESGAANANAQAALKAKLSALQDAQQSAAVTKTLPDGRIRYYTEEKLARTEGPTRGASFVTEYNPTTGSVRQWMESYNQSGQVIRIHPKSINGQPVDAQHYPPTGAELKARK